MTVREICRPTTWWMYQYWRELLGKAVESDPFLLELKFENSECTHCKLFTTLPCCNTELVMAVRDINRCLCLNLATKFSWQRWHLRFRIKNILSFTATVFPIFPIWNFMNCESWRNRIMRLIVRLYLSITGQKLTLFRQPPQQILTCASKSNSSSS